MLDIRSYEHGPQIGAVPCLAAICAEFWWALFAFLVGTAAGCNFYSLGTCCSLCCMRVQQSGGRPFSGLLCFHELEDIEGHVLVLVAEKV
jgi:hypothetical protein